MKNGENFVENLVAPAPKLFGNEIVRRERNEKSGDSNVLAKRKTIHKI